MKYLTTSFALFLMYAPLAANDRVVVAVESIVDPSVGAAPLKIEGWLPPEPAESVDLDLGVRSLVADSVVGDLAVRLLFDWSRASGTPTQLLWGVQGDPLQRISLSKWDEFPTEDGTAFTHRLKFPDGLLPSLRVYVLATGELSASWRIEAVSRGHFDLDGVPQRLIVFDCNFDGRLVGDQDRWMAGPTSLLSSLRFSNPKTQMCWLDEASSLAARAIRFVGYEEGKVTIEIGAPCSVSDGLREHFARVQADFAKSYSITRQEKLASEGEDPERPATDAPTVWWYATNLESARAYAERAGKPLLLELTSQSCGYCRLQTLVTHQDAEVATVQRDFACVMLISDLDVAKSYEAIGLDGGVPHTLIFDMQGKETGNMRGFTSPTDYLTGLRAAIR